tara:strand:+ start:9620 stop:10384 length:765 start_codon:yes stop_codon:yes gene_type:complete
MNIEVKESNLELKSDASIKSAFRDFLKKSLEYRSGFLQSEYNIAFDGYSFMGQQDSLNQYDSDMLHSFVLSDFQEVENFPKEFYEFLYGEWNSILEFVKAAEIKLVAKINNPILSELYASDVMGYMMSCNYYPKTNDCSQVAKNQTRLSAHKDVSLFTTFPYGISEGLSFENSAGLKVEVGNKKKVFSFPGYFMEYVTGNKISGLIHQVELPKRLDTERFSFALFSMPKPNSTLTIDGKEMYSEDYYKEYLQLF